MHPYTSEPVCCASVGVVRQYQQRWRGGLSMALPEAPGRQDKPFRFADKPSRQARDKGNLHLPSIMSVTDLVHLLRLRLYKGSEA